MTTHHEFSTIADNVQRRLKARRRQRMMLLIIALGLFFIFILALTYGLRTKIDFFRMPAQLTMLDLEQGRYLRLGGRVVPGTVVRRGQEISFQIADEEATVRVSYQGVLPNLFKEGDTILAEGTLVGPGLFKARRLLAKHDERYEPSRSSSRQSFAAPRDNKEVALQKVAASHEALSWMGAIC